MIATRFRQTRAYLLCTAILLCCLSHDLAATPPPAQKGRYTIGSMVRLLAIDKTRLYYLVVMQDKITEGDAPMVAARLAKAASKSSTKGNVATGACIVVIDKAKALKGARAAAASITSGVSADVASGRLRADLATQLRANLTANLASSVRVVALNSAQLQRLLGSPAMVTGRVAMASDLGSDITASVSGLATIALTESAAPGFAAVGFKTLLGAGTAAEIGAIAPMVAVAAAGGYATGTAMNGVATAALSAATGKSNYTLGDAIYDLFVGDDDTPNPPADGKQTGGQPPASTPPASTPPASNPPASNPPASTPPASDNQGGGSGEDESGDDDSSDDDNSDDSSNDDAGNGDGGESAGTSLPPDLQNDSPIGTLVMYAATGLCRSEMQRQLAALDIAGGGALGTERRRVTDLHWDKMLGGFYLNTIVRGLESRRNRQGQREPIATYIQMPDKRMFINGLVCPPPRLDYMVAAAAAVGK